MEPAKTLKDTVELMNSEDYKERFIAEYLQLKIRYTSLSHMISDWDEGCLSFTPTCPRSIYDLQLRYMSDYLTVLEARAAIEGIDLSLF